MMALVMLSLLAMAACVEQCPQGDVCEENDGSSLFQALKSSAKKEKTASERVSEIFQTSLSALNDNEMYHLIKKVMEERKELQNQLVADWTAPVTSATPVQEPSALVQDSSDVPAKAPCALIQDQNDSLPAHQDFVFTLMGVKTTRQQWTDQGNLPPKTLNVAVKFRAENNAGEPYASCVALKQMGKAQNCTWEDAGSQGAGSGSGYPWYNLMYDIMTEEFLTPTPELPQQIYWEIVNLAMARRFMAEFDGKDVNHPKIIGVSTLMQVDGTAQTLTKAGVQGKQPGNHGTLATIGEIEPLDYNILSFSDVYRRSYPSDETVAPYGAGWFAWDKPVKGPEWSKKQPPGPER